MHRVIVPFLAVMSIGVACAGAADDAAPSAMIAATLNKRVPPRYPAKAIERGQEGWVDLSFSITPEGTTANIHVVASYPRGVFEQGAVNAVTKWLYVPRMEHGVAVPQADNRAVLGFALAESAEVREPLLPAFTATAAQIQAQQWDAATKAIKDLLGTQALSLYELAMIEQLRGKMAFIKHDYAAAVDSFNRALSITARFDPQTRAGISELLVMAAINGGDFPRAVVAFDAWNPPDTQQTREIRRTVETVRAALASGRAIQLNPPKPAP